MNPARHAPAAAFFAAIAGIALFSVMDATMKGLVLAIGTFATLFWRSPISLMLSAALYFTRRQPWPEPSTLRIHIGRGGLITLTGVLFFWGLARVPLAQGIALTFIAPLIAIYLGAVVLKEKVGRRVIGASLMSFAGVLVIVGGQARANLGTEALIGAAAVLAGAGCYAINLIVMRRQSMVSGPVEVGFFQNLTVMVLMLVALPIFGAPVPALKIWPFIALAGLLSTGSTMVLSWAYARAGASYLANSEYTAFLWASLFGWLIFHEVLSPFTIAGTGLIIAGCVLAVGKRPQDGSEAAV